ncbi:ABC transporter ATP-binding protein [Chloroflexi bacterium TSY]|nr:ABC transporter ATP-binding protein [Chloroflexi bacterium TSY]
MFAIETQNLTRRYGKLTAVDNLDLQVPIGSLFGLIGPNGAGKTTTLRMLAGLLEPSSGEIYLHGESTRTTTSQFRYELGYMPDFFGVYEDMLVWEYLDFFARCYRIPSKRRKQLTDELLELVDLVDKRDEYVESLSRGMRQRLCLAHALVHDPKVLLLDEPASGLDPRARVEMRELLRELGVMGKTVIVSSHILAELSELCDSVGIIEGGRLVVSGPIDRIAHQAHAKSRLLRIQTLSDIDSTQAILEGMAGISQTYANEDAIEVDFNGDDQDVVQLLAALVHRGVPVIGFSEVSSDLEEVFMRLTEGNAIEE